MTIMPEKQPEVGDIVEVLKEKDEKESGILLESHEPGIMLLKLKNGYNIGIKKEDIIKIKIKEKGEKKKDLEEKISLKQGGKPRIDIIMVGGTILASLDYKTGGVSWLTSPERLLRFYPEIGEIADVKLKNPFMKASESMDYRDWQKMAKEVINSLNDEQCRGVIILMGTDFLHYASAALSFFLNDLNKPVVLTYSQRSSDRGSSDATLNLVCSAKAALSDIAEVIVVGHATENDDYCYALQGNKCRKMHTSRRDTFKPINTSPIARISRENIEILRGYNKRAKKKSGVNIQFEPKIGLIKFYPGQDPGIMDYYISKKYKGLVIEMSGLGHVVTEGVNNWIPYIKKAVEKGMIICAAPQTLYGSLQPKVYSPGRELEKAGVIYLKDILPETALVKLGCVLGRAKNNEEARILMIENLAGEFNERLGEEFC